MNDKILLQNVRLAPDSIWGDKNETVVYAQVFTLDIRRGSMPIFRFYRNPRHSPKSLANRVVNYYYKTNVHDDALSFINGAAMQTAIWSSIASVWPRCETDRNILKPSTMIDISSDDSDGLLWCVYQSPLFDEYLGLFRHIKRSDLVPPTNFSPTIDISKIRLRRYLGSRGCA
ncbi:hypothetical protein CEP53_002311 [Fusarium sp. AF-6]|nr:hypothetical protein CEP53_002311 [Fusarium sp. AF-6]